MTEENKEQATQPKHETHKGNEPIRQPKQYKKEITIDFDLYQFELQKHLKQGFEGGYSRALQVPCKYIKGDKTFSELFGKQEVNGMWEHTLACLGKEDEWKEYLVNLEKKEEV